MDIDIKYIEENFIESNKLCQILKIPHKDLEKLIDKKIIPNSFYEISITYKINSPLDDEKIISEVKKYYPKSIIDLIKKIKISITLLNSRNY